VEEEEGEGEEEGWGGGGHEVQRSLQATPSRIGGKGVSFFQVRIGNLYIK
jgi:hypothetical protein